MLDLICNILCLFMAAVLIALSVLMGLGVVDVTPGEIGSLCSLTLAMVYIQFVRSR